MHVTPLAIADVLLIEPRMIRDERGWFLETWRASRFAEHGVGVDFVQDNVSRSKRGVVRGMHFQHPHGQAKLVTVVHGEIFDVAVDVRRGSPTFSRWVGAHLGTDPVRQLFIPAGFAHGFLALSDEAVVSYKVSQPYAPDAEHTIAWNDDAVGIEWPAVGGPMVSARDAIAPRLHEVPDELLPSYDDAAMVVTNGAPHA